MSVSGLAQFRAAVQENLLLFGLQDWEVQVLARDLGPDCTTTEAQADLNYEAHAAQVYLNTGCTVPKAERLGVRDLARHEVLHILLHDLVRNAADSGNVSSPRVDATEHAVIQRLLVALRTL
jgi:hypothetical protein